MVRANKVAPTIEGADHMMTSDIEKFSELFSSVPAHSLSPYLLISISHYLLISGDIGSSVRPYLFISCRFRSSRSR